MIAKKGPSLSELRVGIFVVIACGVLAVAIFAIGSQVGLFEDQFWATTFLSNVSGLKPGDVVLLGGVEVGNVNRVQITEPGDTPETTENLRLLRRVTELTGLKETVQQRLNRSEEQFNRLEDQLQRAISESGPNTPEVDRLEKELDDLRDTRGDLLRRQSQLDRDISNEMAGLQNIQVEMRINTKYRDWIKADSNISLGSIGLLGDKYIEISLGRTEEPPRTELRSFEGWLGARQTEYVIITGTQQASFGELITGANDILANFETLSDQVQDIMGSFEAGEGTIGKFITDPSFYNNLNQTIENANNTMQKIGGLVDSISIGQGTFSKLIRDDALYSRLTSVSSNLDGILAKINEGEGTLGKLVSDTGFYENTNEILADVRTITGRIESGEGTLGRLSAEDELYVALRETTEELAAILKDMQEGKGTLGKLAKDEELYGNLNDASSEIVKLLYDFRQDPKKFLTIKFELF